MAERDAWRPVIAGLVVGDLAVYGLTMLLASAALLRPGTHVAASSAVVALALPVVAVLFAAQGLYDPETLFSGSREFAAVLRACLAAALALAVIVFATRLPVSREWVLLTGLLTVLTVGAGRFAGRRARDVLRRRGLLTSRAVLLGADAQAVTAAHRLRERSSGIELVGVLDDYLPMGTAIAPGLEVLGPSSRLAELAAALRARDVIVVPDALPWESLQAVLGRSTQSSDGLRVHLVGGLYDILAAGVRLSERNGIPLLTARKAALTRAEAWLKRALDCGLSAALLVLLGPVAVFEALRLRALGAPVLVRRRVCDRDGRPFDLLGFPAGLATGSTLVRKLPGLLNVLMGQLSIVGPRPVQAAEATRQPQPFALRPGLTGLWRQVEEPAEQLVLDLYYVRSYSIWLDLQVLSSRLRSRVRSGRLRVPAGDPWPVRPA
jgi:lipopolysaccharide/colanic/teichoic acid biosynthesis glycosyltransferase